MFLILHVKGEVEESTSQLLVNSVLAVADTYFTPKCTVVISLPRILKSEHSNGINNLATTCFTCKSPAFKLNSLLYTLLVSLNERSKWLLTVSYPEKIIKNSDPTDWDTSNNDLHGSYIVIAEYHKEFFIESVMDIKRQIEKLEFYSAWNSRAKFVILLITESQDIKEIVKAILEALWNWDIMNAVVMTPLESAVNVYTWFPYVMPSGSCGELREIVLLDIWTKMGEDKGKFLRNSPIFPNKIPNDLHGCPIRASTFEFYPFIICDPNLTPGMNTSIVDGLEIRLMRAIAKAMKMTLILRIPPGEDRGGIQLENGTWTGLRADIVYGRADITFASLLSKLEDHLIFDDTRNYFTDRFTWFVARAKPYPRWLGMVRVFSSETWLVGFLSIILAGFLMKLLSSFSAVQIEEVSYSYWRFMNCFSSMWAVFLGAGVPLMPQSAPLRIFFLAMVIYSLAINTVFQAFFTSYVVNPGLLHQIENLEELVDADLVYAFYYVLDKFHTKEFLNKLKPRVFCEPFTCLDYVATKDNYATFCGRALLAYIVDSLVKQEGKHEIYAFREDSFQLNSIMLLPKGSHLLDRVNEVMTHLVEAGMPNQYLKAILDMRKIQGGVIALVDLSDEYAPLTMNHLQGSFYFLLIGLAFSSIIYIFEISVLKLKYYFKNSFKKHTWLIQGVNK